MEFQRPKSPRRVFVAIALAMALLLVMAPYSGKLARALRVHAGVSLTFVAYSTPKDAYDLIFPAFQKTRAGKGVSFSTSYGASGDQSRAVSQGLNADLVAFSLEPDINRLVKQGLVRNDWYKNNKYRGFVTTSVVVFAVRQGNPKHIRTWSDLLKPDIAVITPNPFTSGGARWNVMAAYGAQISQKKKPAQATDYLRRLFDHVVVQDRSARDALVTFNSGKGDVMLAYENEAITARQKGEKIDFVIPPQTILIENPAAVMKTSKHQKEAKALLSFLWTRTAQKIFGEKGYRPVDASAARTFHYRKPSTLFTIRSLGSWPTVMTKFFDPQNGVMARIERDKGVSP